MSELTQMETIPTVPECLDPAAIDDTGTSHLPTATRMLYSWQYFHYSTTIDLDVLGTRNFWEVLNS